MHDRLKYKVWYVAHSKKDYKTHEDMDSYYKTFDRSYNEARIVRWSRKENEGSYWAEDFLFDNPIQCHIEAKRLEKKYRQKFMVTKVDNSSTCKKP